MHVLFIALGATRKRAVREEAAEAVACGHTVLVLTETAESWRDQPFAPGVELVEMTRLELRHAPRFLEWALLFRAPRAAVSLLGRGPLRRPVGRAGRSYERRLARRVHHRLFLPCYRGLYGDAVTVRHRLARQLVRERSVDHVVVCDPASMPMALQLTRRRTAPGARGGTVSGRAVGTGRAGDGVPVPGLSYSAAHLEAAV
ncbi:hypothetical protein ACWGJ2_24910 [Streptomyces sp. NPDC054796]